MANYKLDYQLAQMSTEVYKIPAGAVAGWTVVDAEPKNGQDKANGFAAAAYRNNTTGDVVIAYRGTSEKRDAGADLAIGSPLAAWDSQFKDTLDFAKRVKDAHPHAAISVTGHSLGGGLAQVASQAYGFHGITFDPAGAENIVRSSQFKEWTSSHGLGNGKGVPSNFQNYLVAHSPISHASGAHLGATTEISSISGRNTAEVAATKAARILGPGIAGGAGFVMDTKGSHKMERIEGMFKEAAETGRLPKVYPVIGQGDSDTKFAINEVPNRYAPLHAQVGEHINRLYSEKGIDWANGGDNTVAKCTAGCVEKNVTEAQFASVENGKINIGQKDGFEWKVASVDAVEAARTPQQESFAQLAALDLQQSQKLDNPVQTQTKTQSGPSIG